MGQIVYLESRARPIRPTPPVQGDAQILFFLGVRYMRMDEYSAPTSDSPTGNSGDNTGGRKRKRRARG